MLIFSIFLLVLCLLYHALLAGRPLTAIERCCVSIFLSIMTVIYAPQVSSVLCGTLNIWAMIGLSTIPLFFLFFYERSRLSLGGVNGSFSQSFQLFQELSQEVFHNGYLMGLLLLTAGASILVIWVFTNFSNFGWDGWTYHTSAMAWFNQQDTITTTMPLMRFVTSYPKNIEFLSLWIYKLSGDDSTVDGANLLIHIAAIFFIYGISKQMGLNRYWSLAASFIYFLTPNLLTQSWSTYIDGAFSDSIAMVLFFYLSWYASSKDEKLFWVILLGFGLGHLAQTKGSGLHVIVIIGSLLMIREVIEGRVRALPRHLILIGAFTLLSGAGWYLKNWYIYGNPFYPFQLALPGTNHILFPGDEVRELGDAWGSRENIPAWWLYLSQFAEIGSQASSIGNRHGGWGAHYFFLGLPAMVIILLQGNANLRWLMLFIVAYFVLIPFSFWARYSLIASLVGAVAFGYVVQEILKTRIWYYFLVVLSLCLLTLSLVEISAILGDNASRYVERDFATRDGFQRFALVNRYPGAKIGITNLEYRAHGGDNPFWYFYFGSHWANHVEPFNPAKTGDYDFVICGLSTNCPQLVVHHLILIENNIAVFQRNE